MKKATLLSLILAPLMFTAHSLHAQDEERPFGHLFPKESQVFRNLIQSLARSALNFRAETPLSEEQRLQVRAVLGDYQQAMFAQAESARDARRLLHDMLRTHGAESPETHAAAEGVGEVARQRALLMAKIHEELHPILTPEQQDSLDAARAEVQDVVDTSLQTLVQP